MLSFYEKNHPSIHVVVPRVGAVTNGKPAYIISNSKVNLYGGNIFTQANESSPIPHIIILFIHNTWLMEWDVNRLMGRSEVREVDWGAHAERLQQWRVLFRCRFLGAGIALVCRQFAIRRPPVCICLTASGEPGPSGALFIRELSPAGSPHRCCTHWHEDTRLHCVV